MLENITRVGFNYILCKQRQFMPAAEPPAQMIEQILEYLVPLYTDRPLASSNEAYLQNRIEHHFIFNLGYSLRIGINYHGGMIQLIRVNPVTGRLVGWNQNGSVFGIGHRNKLIMTTQQPRGESTVFPREPNESTQTDTKLQAGPNLNSDQYVRIEHKVRGWDGKSKNLDGKQFLKDIVLLQGNEADLLHWSLSEAAYRKWRGERPRANQRAGLVQFQPILGLDPDGADDRADFNAQVGGDFTPAGNIEGGAGRLAEAGVAYQFALDISVTIHRVRADANSIMPTAEHYIVLIRRR
jgi:hypothetical protein